MNNKLDLQTIYDKDEIQTYLCRNIPLHIYGIGDLDDFFWDRTRWFGARGDAGLQAIILLYEGLQVPVLHALGDDLPALDFLLKKLAHSLPNQIHVHLSPGLESALRGQFDFSSRSDNYKMLLQNPSQALSVPCAEAERLGPDSRAEILELYRCAYPDGWFDPRMLETGQCFGIRSRGILVSIAGVHVFSPHYRVAALGNIATRPAFRGQGLAQRVTARLCRSLLEHCEYIGLNVSQKNVPALTAYRKLGFEIIATYHEYMLNKI